MATTGATQTEIVVKKEPKRKFMVINRDDNNIEYVIKTKTNKDGDRIFKLFYSKSEIWTKSTRGQLALTLTNNGNSVIIKLVDKLDLSELQYHELEQLRILLKFESKMDGETPHKIVEY